jgi:integrase
MPKFAKIHASRTGSVEISALVNSYVGMAQSASSTKSYALAIRHFRANGGKIPASPEMVADYISRFANSLAIATLQHRLIAIHRAHTDDGHASPVSDKLVKRTMQGIRRTYGTAQRRVQALVKDDLLEMLALAEKQGPLKAARDIALLLVGFAGAFRRSELVGLRVDDMTEYPDGIEMLLRRSKTDQMGEGRTVFIPQARGARCPVKALAHWLKTAGISEGWLFRPVNRHDKLASSKALSPQSVALVVKQATRRARGAKAAEDVSAHSLRAGYVTTAAIQGLQPYQIREVTGHRSDAMLARYIRPVAKRKVPSLL